MCKKKDLHAKVCTLKSLFRVDKANRSSVIADK
jgi:hypothetical protein